MKKRFFLYSISAVFALFGCQKKLAELDFFEVSMAKPESPELGVFVLKGSIAGLSGGAAIDECGFVISENFEDAADPSVAFLAAAASKITATAPSGNGDFEASKSVDPSQTFYLRAFARLGERMVFSPKLQQIGLPSIVEMSLAPAFVRNDSALLQGFLFGLDSAGKAVAHGHVFSKASENNDPKVGGAGCVATDLGPTDDDGLFQTQAAGLEFNTDYVVRAYVKTASGKFLHSKKTALFRVRGGWRRVANFPVDLQGGSVAAAGGAFYAGLGANVGTPVGQQDYSKTVWRFSPPSPSAPQGNWAARAEVGAGSLARNRAAVFGLGEGLFSFGGSLAAGGASFLLVNDFLKYDAAADAWAVVAPASQPPKRSDAVAFSANGKGYVGAGWTASPTVDLADFWEFDPAANAFRQVAALPSKANAAASQGYEGRRGAVAVADSQGKIYAGGGGSFTGLNRSDFWRFEPPTSPQDSGKWFFEGFLPGPPRRNAVALAIGDRIFYGLGENATLALSDWWEFDAANGWRQKTAFSGAARSSAMGFSSGGAAFVGTGVRYELQPNLTRTPVATRDFWMYAPDAP